ncbi:aminotransferase class IV [Maribacter sp. CXY002]|uniref:aminotransferase class IV n=1 Tax=Maribacter luteocoastalis TaxID=3407671 RepID=UPI003B6701E2
MVNFNGELYGDEENFLNHNNRGLRYGDALFEAIRVVNGHVFFLEEHYLRLMSSMRILRMEIPMNLTMEFLEGEILKTIAANPESKGQRIRVSVFRNNGGLYKPTSNDISYIIESKELTDLFYTIPEQDYEIELFKDFYVNNDMLSTLKTNNKILNVVGSVFASENGYDNCLLLNNQKQVVEALNGNVFLVKGNTIKTPPLSDGCLNGIVRKKIIEIISKLEDYMIIEESISPFELQKADEMFLTNTISGIIPVSKYRKKKFSNKVSLSLVGKLNLASRVTV